MRSFFVLWSGGIDSTYLIVRLLESGFKVRAGYINIRNNCKKTQMEQYTIEQLSPIIRERFKNFSFDGTIFSARNSSPLGRGLKYKQVPYFMHALLIAPKTDFRALGYVQGDSAIKNLEQIRNVYNSYELIHNGNFPKLIFPLKNTTKPQIFEYMSRNYPAILEHCVWCENPQGINFNPCRNCTPCKRHMTDLNTLAENELIKLNTNPELQDYIIQHIN